MRLYSSALARYRLLIHRESLRYSVQSSKQKFAAVRVARTRSSACKGWQTSETSRHKQFIIRLLSLSFILNSILAGEKINHYRNRRLSYVAGAENSA